MVDLWWEDHIVCPELLSDKQNLIARNALLALECAVNDLSDDPDDALDVPDEVAHG